MERDGLSRKDQPELWWFGRKMRVDKVRRK